MAALGVRYLTAEMCVGGDWLHEFLCVVAYGLAVSVRVHSHDCGVHLVHLLLNQLRFGSCAVVARTYNGFFLVGDWQLPLWLLL
jgi:hypothetical protein